MKKLPISFDLDNTVFDVSSIYLKAWDAAQQKKPKKTRGYPTRWDFHNDPFFPKDVGACLEKLFLAGELLNYNCSEALAEQLNRLIDNPQYDVYFITDRNKEHDNYGQLLRNKIKVSKSHLILSHDKHKSLAELGILIHCDDNPRVLESLSPRFQGTLPVLMSNAKTPYNHYLRGRALDFGEKKIKVPTYRNLSQALDDFDAIVDTLMKCLNIEKFLTPEKRGKK